MPRLVRANSVEGVNDNAGPRERFRNRCKYHADAGVERGYPGEMKRGVSARHTQKESTCSETNGRQVISNGTTVAQLSE